MNVTKTKTLAAEDTKRRAFSPIHMDLVERLTRECDNMSSNRPRTAVEKSGDSNRLAA